MAVRLNITMDEDVYKRLKQEVLPKKISAFINTAVRAKIHPDKKTLDAAYRAASKERWRKGVAEDWRQTDTEGWPA
jgi:post-segregation antitoxin (ccd killing protein)